MSSLISPEARLSYPALFEAREGPGGGEPKYGCCLVFEAEADLSMLRKAVHDAVKAKWGEKAGTLLETDKVRMPFRDGAEKYGSGTTFINVSSKFAPGVVDRYPGPDGKPAEITDPDELYPGCYVRAALRAFAYDRAGNKGVSFGLNGIQKLGEGERLDGRQVAKDMFVATELSPTAFDASSASDLLN